MGRHQYVAYTIKKEFKVDGWESLKPYTIAYIRGWQIIEQNLKPIHDNLHPLNSAKSAFQYLDAGRADIFVSIPFAADPLLTSNDFKNKGIRALHPPIDVLELYIYILSKHAHLADRIAAGVRATM